MPRCAHPWFLLLCALVFAAISSGATGSNQFLLITADLETKPIRLAAVDETQLHFTDLTGDRRQSLPLDKCVAIVKERPAKSTAADPGMLRLTDGRQFPGEPATPRPGGPGEAREVFAWHSSWLGRLDVRLDDIESISLRAPADGGSPRFAPAADNAARRSDTLILTNGDVLEGFIAHIREKVVLEVEDGARTIDIPLDRVASIQMIGRPREPSNDRRVWLADGTIMNVARIDVDEGGIARIAAGPGAAGTRLDVRHLSAVLLSPQRMIPLATLAPSQVSGPETRYTIPPPQALDNEALLGLSPIEMRGPIRIEYELPKSATRFAAKAILPESSRHYGDFDLIIYDGEREAFRQRLNAANPIVNINVPLSGSSFMIELTPGAHGAIHNHVILNRAMLRLP